MAVGLSKKKLVTDAYDASLSILVFLCMKEQYALLTFEQEINLTIQLWNNRDIMI